jgi:hypothetical protein
MFSTYISRIVVEKIKMKFHPNFFVAGKSKLSSKIHNFQKGGNSQLIISPAWLESGHDTFTYCRGHSNDHSWKK